MAPTFLPRRIGWLVVLATAALLTVAPHVDAAPVAMVTDVVGDVKHANAPLQILAELDAGREVSLAAGATVVVFYVGDGSEWVL